MMKRMIPLLLAILFLAGCTVSRKVLDELTLVTMFGYDLAGNGDEKIEATIGVPIFEPQGKISNTFYSATGEFGRDLDKKLMLNTPKPIGGGKVEVTIFGEAFARQGIKEALDIAQRDPSISSNLKMAVYDGKVKEFVQEQNVPNQDLGIFLAKTIEQNMQSETIPKTNVHLFFQPLYAQGKDPILPYISLKDGKVKIKGIALFRDDKMVSHIDDEMLYQFTMLSQPVKSGSLAMLLEKFNAGVSLTHINSNRNVEISGTMDSPTIQLNLELNGSINEYYGAIKGIEKQTVKIEKEINKQFHQEAVQLIRSFQEINVDPIGFGKEAKAHFRNWDYEKWKDIYPTLDIDVNIETNIIESGIIR